MSAAMRRRPWPSTQPTSRPGPWRRSGCPSASHPAPIRAGRRRRPTVAQPAEAPTPTAIGPPLGPVGDEGARLIVRSALAAARRYGTWKAELGISDAVLSARLAAL